MAEVEVVEYRPIMIRDLATEDRPRERLMAHGSEALSTAELLAILLRVGIAGMSAVSLAQHILKEFHGLPGIHRATPSEIGKVKGLGPAKATQIKAGLELGRRLNIAQSGEKIQIKSPTEAANFLMADMAYLEHEELKLILLDTKNNVIHNRAVTLYRGSLNSSVVRVGEVFREAVKTQAAALIVAHNHPSGDPTPSPEDIRVTTDIVKAGKILEIDVLDHIIIGHHRFISLKERGLGFM